MTVSAPKPSTKACRFCGIEVDREAWVCPSCNRETRPSLAVANMKSAALTDFNPGAAAVLSFLFPGLGQVYKGQIGMGITWPFIVILGYCLVIVPGIIAHVYCVYDAYHAEK